MALGRTNRIRPALLVAAALAVLGLLVSGCGGGGGSPQVANIGPGTTTTGDANEPSTSASGTPAGSGGTPRSIGGGGGTFSIAGGGGHMAQFASCMRSHGVPNFPDPNAQGTISISSSSGIDPSSPQFQQAQRACAKDLPNGGTPSPAQQAQMRQQALAYSACMRSHGLPNFPDPQFGSGGRVQIKIDSSSGIDPRSPQFQAAQNACQSKLPGKASRSGRVGSGATAGNASTGGGT